LPFKSESQRRYLWANHPEIAQRWSNESKGKRVPKKRSNLQRAAQKRLTDGGRGPKGEKQGGPSEDDAYADYVDARTGGNRRQPMHRAVPGDTRKRRGQKYG
jgi:hypothetical protein